MNRFHLSVRSLMVAMFAVALNVSAMRTVASRPGELTGVLGYLAFGTLPMASVLVAVGIFGPRRSRFWRAFQVAGWSALVAGIVCWMAAPGVVEAYLETVLDFFGDATGLSSSETWAAIEEVCVIPLLLLVPQMTLAVAGGVTFGRGPGAETMTAEYSFARGGSWIRPVATMIIILAVPVAAFEGHLRSKVDPQVARLASGSRAVLHFPESSGYFIPFSDGQILAPNGTPVRVEEDRQPSVMGKAMGNGSGPYGDLRRVRVTVLTGEARGRTAEFFRCNLQVQR